MTSADLTREQAQKMHDSLEPALKYLNKLMKRMQHRTFDHDDKLWQRSRAAQTAMLDLITELRFVAHQAKKKAP